MIELPITISYDSSCDHNIEIIIHESFTGYTYKCSKCVCAGIESFVYPSLSIAIAGS